MIIKIGALDLSFYGLVYLFAVLLLFVCLVKSNGRNWHTLNQTIILSLGAILGGRIGYIIFYEPSYYLSNLAEIVELYKGGMSYHGGVIGVLIALFLIKKELRLVLLDKLCILALIIIPLGRIANFLNGELWGRVTDNTTLGMVFERADNQLRYPSQLFEAIAEGPILAIFLYLVLKKKTKKAGILSAYYIIFYSLLRFIVEFTREPDAFIGYIDPFYLFSQGQLLCLLFFIVGIYMLKKLSAKGL